MKIRVTEQHIKEGERRNSTYCAVAIAAADAYGKPRGSVRAHLRGLEFYDKPWNPNKRENYSFPYYIDSFPYYISLREIPSEVGDWIQKFDENEEVEPFEFEVED